MNRIKHRYGLTCKAKEKEKAINILLYDLALRGYVPEEVDDEMGKEIIDANTKEELCVVSVYFVYRGKRKAMDWFNSNLVLPLAEPNSNK